LKARSLTDTPWGSVISRRESQHRKAEDPICCSLLSGEITTSSRLVFLDRNTCLDMNDFNFMIGFDYNSCGLLHHMSEEEPPLLPEPEDGV
jgi:hypothetical protein